MTNFVDLGAKDVSQNPYPVLAQLRAQNEPARVKTGTDQSAVLFTRYDDVKAILSDKRFINDRRKLPGVEDWTKKWYIPGALKLFADTMALADEPDHGRLKQLVHKAFTPSRIRDMESNIQTIADELLAEMNKKKQIDFVEDFALPLPLIVICDMMGVDRKDRNKFHKWMANTITNPSNNAFDMLHKIMNTFGMNRFLSSLVDDRRANPTDDLTSALVQAEADGETLTERELLAMLFLLLFAGHETTVSLLGGGMLTFLKHPDQWQMLRNNPNMLDGAIDEMLRYLSPVLHIATRYAAEDVMIRDVELKQGQAVMLHVASANRDENIFENADQFDITRDPNPHIAFGFGVHYCLGAPLARMETKIAFTKLLERYESIELAAPAETLKWRGAPALRGLESLPMRVTKSERVATPI